MHDGDLFAPRKGGPASDASSDSCMTSPSPVLHVHRADRADALVAALGELLAVPPADPFVAEVVGVPTRGVERWLTQSLSCAVGATNGRGDGIVANVAFPSPREIVDAAVAAACGVDVDADPWAPGAAVHTKHGVR